MHFFRVTKYDHLLFTSYVICNRDGVLLRRMPSMTEEKAEKYAKVNRKWSSLLILIPFFKDLNSLTQSPFSRL